jgi:hypothetical protein
MDIHNCKIALLLFFSCTIPARLELRGLLQFRVINSGARSRPLLYMLASTSPHSRDHFSTHPQSESGQQRAQREVASSYARVFSTARVHFSTRSRPLIHTPTVRVGNREQKERWRPLTRASSPSLACTPHHTQYPLPTHNSTDNESRPKCECNFLHKSAKNQYRF